MEGPWLWAMVLRFAIGAKGSMEIQDPKSEGDKMPSGGGDWHQDEKDIRKEKLVSGRYKET